MEDLGLDEETVFLGLLELLLVFGVLEDAWKAYGSASIGAGGGVYVGGVE